MSTKAYYPRTEIGPGKVGFSKTRSIIEAPFYGNNVIKVNTLREAYELAKNSPGTVVTDMPVYRGEEFGLEPDAKVLLFNDGSITGRYAPARRITGKEGVNTTALDKILMDAVYDTRWKTMYHAEVYIGLDPEFMVKAHLLIPEGEENLLYNWMLNFQYINEEYAKRYEKSRPLANDGDIYVFADPYWTHPDYPLGLAFFSPEQNCAAMAVDELTDYLENGNIRRSVNLPDMVMDRSGVERLCILHKNVPGMLANITSLFGRDGVNVENLSNKSRGEYAYTMVDLGTKVAERVIEDVQHMANVIRVRVLEW